MKWSIVVALVLACGGKKDDAPAAEVSAVPWRVPP